MKTIRRVQPLIHMALLVTLLMALVGPGGRSQPTAYAATPAGNISYIYDEAGRLTGVIDPASDAATYKYDAVGNILSIGRQSSSLVSLIEFTPNSGPSGSSVTIFGTGFSTIASQNAVTFNGVAAAVTSATTTQLVVSVPSGATTGPIAVTTPAGSATSATSFVVTASTGAPTISAFTPTIGAAGTAVTISGANFDSALPNNKVILNGTRALVNSATASTMSASVPPGATSGKFSVATPDGRVTSSGDFFVPPSPYTAADVEFTGRMAIGESKAVTISTANKIGLMLFDGSQGQRVSLKLSNVTMGWNDVSILKPDGTTLVNPTFVTNSGQFIDTQTLPASGTYTIVVDPESSNAGSTTLTLYDVPADLTSSITIGGPAVTISTTTPGQNAKLTFSGTTGQRISLKLSNVTMGWNDVSILKPDGTTLVNPTFVTNSGQFIDTQTLPASGTYTIVVDPESSNAGSTTLTLYDVPADLTSSITIGGPAVTISTTTPGQNAKLTFSGTTGQRISLKLSNVTMGWNDVSILKPDGTTLVNPTFVTNSGGTITALLTADGVYTIVVDPESSNTGSMTLTLTQATTSAQVAAVTIAHPSEQTSQPGGKQQMLAPTSLSISAQENNQPSNGPESSVSSPPPLQAAIGVTALAGQVLTLDGKPLANVTLEIDEVITQTDTTGRFLLQPLPPGHHELKIEGNSANRPGRSYGVFEAGVDVSDGHTNVLPYTIWMTELDTAHTVKFASPTTQEVVLITPKFPGLEVHIPKGAVITDEDGQPVTELGITAIPTDHPPFPLPKNVDVPLYFTVQPGGAYITPAAWIVYPNYQHDPPGALVNFWNYDASAKGWYIYGVGTVTADGKQVIPNPGVRVYEFSGAMINGGGSPPPSGPPPGGCGGAGDPVDCATGLFLLETTDLLLPDTMPLALTRTYRPGDSASRPFGIGTTHPYAMFLWSANQYQEADLILPDGGRVHYVRISSGTGWSDAVFEHTATQTAFYKSRIKWNGNGWDLILADGTVYVFGENAPLQAIRDRYGNQITITHANGQSGNITSIRSPNGRWIAFTYDASNRITRATDNIGRLVNYTYDTSGRLWKVTDPNGGVTEYSYDSANRMLTVKDPRGNVVTTNLYDASGRVAKQTLADGTTYLFAYTVDTSGRITQTDVTDPRGIVRRITFNASGYPLSNTYALGKPEQQTSTYERQTGTNLLLNVTDPLGRKTAYTYDAIGHITGITQLAGTPQAVTTSFSYEPKYNQVASITDPLGHTTTLAYDANGNPTSITDPLGHTTTLTYNAVGQPLSVADALNHTTRFSYDAGDLVAITDPLGRISMRFSDSAGRLVSQTDLLGNRIRLVYDVLNRLVRATDPLGAVTSFAYDPNDNLLSLTDANSHVTSYTYDTMNRPISRIDSLGRIEREQYDAAGNLVSFTDRKAQVTSFQYDSLNRRVFIGFGTTVKGGTPSYQSTIAGTYDAGDRLTKLVDSSAGTTTHAYDNLNRLLSEATPQGSISYTYDAAGRRTSMTVAGQPAVDYSYDNADRLTQIRQGTATVSFAYDAADRHATLTLPNGVSLIYGYDTASQLTGMTYKLGSTLLGDLTYAYDGAGRRSQLGGSYAHTDMPQPVASASYDAANQLTRWGTVTLTYDANGNLTGDGAKTYTWNARDQLASIKGTKFTASFQHDAFGRRVTKTVNGTTTSFLYDGLNPVQELVGGTPSANLLTGQGVDEYFTRTDAAGTRTLLTDGLGSTMALADSTGTVQTQYTYDPFGNTTVSGATNGNAFQYTGRENDGTGLYYYRARYYSPSMQRFISQDPIGFAGGLNLYAYVGNNPVNWVDPRGLEASALSIGLGAILCAGGGCEAAAAIAAGIVLVGGVAYIGYTVYHAIKDHGDRPAIPADKSSDPSDNQCPNHPPIPNDPTTAPGSDWEWRGKPPIGGDKGNWYNPGTDESLHPDLNHPEPIGPHWDYKDPAGDNWRIFPDGTSAPK